MSARIPAVRQPISAAEISSFLCRDEPLILEIGAHDGSDTEEILAACPGAFLHCFEPEPSAISQFEARGLPQDRCKLHRLAVGDVSGEVTFYQSSGSRGACRNWNLSGSILEPKEHLDVYPWCEFKSEIVVECVRLDDWFEARERSDSHVDFIRADVQGAEARLIRGGRQTLEMAQFFYTEFSNRELYAGQPDLEEIMAMLPRFSPVKIYGNNILLENTRYSKVV